MMILKKSSSFLAAANSFHSFTIPTATTQPSTSSRPGPRPSTRQKHAHRSGYATIAGDARDPADQQERSEPDHVWPTAPKGLSQPTPYQIFELKQSAAYSKGTFNRLVKLYHPDLNSRCNHGVADNIKMERYRLIVAAHTILSDPAKRSAYDRFGAGWEGKAEFGSSSWGQPSAYGGSQPFTHSYDPNDTVWANATWEDWERWRENKEGIKRERPAPVYMANSYFLALIVALAVMGSSLNYGRAQEAGHYFVEQRDIVHDRAAKELRKVRQEASMNSRQDRIDYFLRNRDATMGTGDYEALREEKASRVLKDKEICRSDGISEQNGQG
ncbi:NADH-dependent flavin oxidoreductase iliE [Fulvia fulva]|uniref:NADH-dependent flavin oxidoreductase iliE n=1 Tax=Passalora fulva TaxID=5499 RepID=A0A9Q8UV35_PASFU|nr:NADH-dependent flavin oxidoreductase iliE [Fulvia fulva]KAK4612286.1 NADH-dependent flavin oxidoreductase iliE [Fulvia fulva]KAK4612949.1 NADH-dependent flavin oxidoreductase iliE [Fulvia fulva]UJO23558.1 NADH-dependent flavin oxidoreductase iliE [Fulvia fulva]WPV21190.1 NADH-dependent flavin oxidoreductase iliE [Fulvia fulva]WPV36474.1 NADH-dependent flavin oxidoreductase iliE [Fulvia fulva]